jgi:hypothetical protein
MLEPELVRWNDEQSSIARQIPKIPCSVAISFSPICSLPRIFNNIYIFTARNFYLI